MKTKLTSSRNIANENNLYEPAVSEGRRNCNINQSRDVSKITKIDNFIFSSVFEFDNNFALGVLNSLLHAQKRDPLQSSPF